MSMRKWLYEAVKSTPGQVAFSADRITSSGAVEGPEGQGDAPDTPFIVIRFSTNQQNVRMPGSRVRQQRVQVWLHTTPGSMISTDDIADALSTYLPSLPPVIRDDEVIISCEWEDTSGDGYDDHHLTMTRYVTFLVTFKPTD